MTFAAFTSALIVRQGASHDWQHFTLPSILYLNSLIIIASSVTLEMSRRQIAAFMGRETTQGAAPSRLLYLTLGLGLLFVAGQTVAWLQLQSQGFGRQQHQLLLLLCADRGSRHPPARWARRAGPRHRKAEPFCFAPEHLERDGALLALYGCAVAVSAFAALDEALTSER
jgi:hypothetical protein